MTQPPAQPKCCRSSCCRSAIRSGRPETDPAVRRVSTLRHRTFRLLLAGELISNFGGGIFLVALPWYVLAHHGGALLLGTVMLWANCIRRVAVAALALSAASAPAQRPVVIVIAIVLGSAEGRFIPASEVIVAALLPSSERRAGIALLSGSTQLSQLAGPALGGLLIALVGPAQGFAIDAGTFLAPHSRSSA
jgi:MFS family permease